MDIAELLPEDHVVVSLHVSDKAQLLQELARRAAAVSNVSQKQILAALEAREKLGSTGLGEGFALPHASIEGLDRFVGLFATLVRPIAYDAVDEKPVDLVFLLLIPTKVAGEYMTILAAISRRMRDQDFTNRLRKSVDKATLRELLAGG
ncbi:MAG: PTS sugar transporter subunit IIA [Methylovirgula sp.]|jgi:nitrogen PTS system EIIA component